MALAGFFPFVGYLFLANQDLVHFLTLVTDGPTDGSIAGVASDRLKQIYFGMLSLSIGVLVYKVSCPLEIAQFGDRYDYIERELPIATPIRVLAIQREMDNLNWWHRLLIDGTVIKEIKQATQLEIGSTEIRDMSYPAHELGPGEKSPKAFQADAGLPILQLLNTHFDMQNSSSGIARIICSLAFGYGYAKLAWPSIIVAAKLING